MKKILFITAYYYPQNAISVVRVGQWVKYLAKNYYEITVLTTKKYAFNRPLNLYPDFHDSKIEVCEIDFLPFLKKTEEKDVQQEKIVLNSHSTLPFFKHVLNYFIRPYFGQLIDVYNLWIPYAIKKANKLWKNNSFDIIISSFNPPASHIIAHSLKKRYPKVKWIADFRDLWAYNHISPAKCLLGYLEKKIEAKILSNADKIITVSDPLTEVMKKVYPDKEIYTIENGFDPDEFKEWKKHIKPFPKIENKIVISYLGTIYPQKQDPTVLFEAVNELIEEGKLRKDQIEINFYGNNWKQLEDIIKPKNLNKFNVINIKGFVKREKSLKIQRESDLLLFLEWNDPSAKGVLTGKLFEYLVSGTPIIAIGISNENAAGKVIEKTKTGKLYLDKEELKKDLLNIFVTRHISFFNPVIKEIEKFSRDKQVKKLIRIINT